MRCPRQGQVHPHRKTRLTLQQEFPCQRHLKASSSLRSLKKKGCPRAKSRFFRVPPYCFSLPIQSADCCFSGHQILCANNEQICSLGTKLACESFQKCVVSVSAPEPQPFLSCVNVDFKCEGVGSAFRLRFRSGAQTRTGHQETVQATVLQSRQGCHQPYSPKICRGTTGPLHENDSTQVRHRLFAKNVSAKTGAFHADDATPTSAEAIQKYFADEISSFHSCGVTTFRPPRPATKGRW